MTWQPIHTIPRDGTKVDILCREGIFSDVYYCDKFKGFRAHCYNVEVGIILDSKYFSHWRLSQPLPEKGTTMWQPIDTIPRDGTKVDLLDNYGDRHVDAYFHEGYFFQDKPKGELTGQKGEVVGNSITLQNKTHWMPSPPLPEPPKKRGPREVWLYEMADGELENFIARIYHPDNPGCFGGSNKKKIVKFREVMEND